ncbi:MAG: hypothetical protein AABY22_04480 [Nanoarchaeota archaeon]
MIKEFESNKKCKDCGKPAYSYQIGWEDMQGITHWHPVRNYNQCKECRAKMYKKIGEKKKVTNEYFVSDLIKRTDGDWGIVLTKRINKQKEEVKE